MRRNVLIFVLALVGVTVAYFFLAFNPQSNRISDTALQADEAEQRVRQLELDVARLEELQRQAPQLRERAARVDTAIPNDPQLAAFILQVQEASNASGIDWLSVSPSPPAAGQQPGVLEVNVAINVTGGYFQVQDFLVRMESLPRAVTIGSVNLGAGPRGLPHLSASLSMKMFVSSAPAAPTPVPSPTG